MTLTLATILTAFALAVVFIAVCVLIHRQISALRNRPSASLDWTPELSVDRYQPMFRLLADDDFQFLRKQPGATPQLVNRLRRQRYQVFRGYLQSLERDFHQAMDALMMLMAESRSDRRDILWAVVSSQVKFSLGVLRVRCHLFLYRWNVGRDSVAPLVSLFESLQLELLALAPSPESARA